MNEQLLRYFFGGFVRLHILYHAAKQPICGVEIMEELGRHGYQLSPGTLYPMLHHLENDGYLKRETRIVEGRRRKYYRITRAGRQMLRRARSQVRELTDELIEDRDSMAKAARGRVIAKVRVT